MYMFLGRPPGAPLPPEGTPMTEKMQESTYPLLHNNLPPPKCPCSPGGDSRSPRSSPSPRPASPVGPDDLSMSKKLSAEPFINNNRLNVSN